MPHTTDWKNNGFTRKFTGFVTAYEVLSSNLELQGDPRFDHCRYVLNDFTEISGFSVTETEIQTIAVIDNVAAKTNPRIRIAIVTSNNDLLKWVEMYSREMEASPFDTMIFPEINDAREWLNAA